MGQEKAALKTHLYFKNTNFYHAKCTGKARSHTALDLESCHDMQSHNIEGIAKEYIGSNMLFRRAANFTPFFHFSF